jgi:predicted PurR-regulated permease PerM
MQSDTSPDITRIVLFVLVLVILLAATAWTLLPFLSGGVWATTIAVATWPALLRVQALAGGRRWAAVTIMIALVLLALIVPFALAVSALVDAAHRSPAVLRDFLTHGLGDPPEWIAKVPFTGPDALTATLQPYARSAATWAIAATGGLGSTAVLVLLTIGLLAILYARGETAARGVLAFFHRLGGDTAERTVVLAAQAVRSVALGVIVTALIQALLAGLGLWFSGVPHPGLLLAMAFMLGLAQLGPLPILLPAIGWLYWSGNVGWAVALLIYSLPVAALDNFVRPMLIRRGVQLPLLLIIGGVIGGLIGFGVIGLFVGPVVLAATYTLARDWVARGQAAEAATERSPDTLQSSS